MKPKLNIVDYSTISYLIITTLLIFSFFDEIKNPGSHLMIRVGFFSVLLLSAALRDYYRDRNFNILLNLIPLAFLGYFYNETADFNHLFFENLDPYIAQIEFNIFSVQPSVVFSEILPNLWFSELMNFGYFSYYLIIFSTPVLFYFKKPELFTKVLFLILSSFYLFYFFFIIIPVVGPQFYFEGAVGEFTPQGPFGHLIKFIQEVGEVPTGAFPSSHVGISLILGYLIFKHLRQYFTSFLLLISILTISTIYIKAHYLLDVIAAFLITPLFYYISNKLYISLHKQYL
ncbi:MAG: phosphatase PAP2 family protein [Bacteroidota bacterium]